MKKVFLITSSIIALLLVLGIYIYAQKIDTIYAIRYARVFGSYDINEVDRYLNEDTLLTYKGLTDSYKNLRKNVIIAFGERVYDMPEGSSYGSGNDCFIDGIQTVDIQAYVDSNTYSSEFVSMEIRRKWLVSYEVVSLTSNDDFFGYLFFGEK